MKLIEDSKGIRREFTYSEQMCIDAASDVLLEIIKRNNLTFAQAIEALEVCRIKMDMCQLGDKEIAVLVPAIRERQKLHKGNK